MPPFVASHEPVPIRENVPRPRRPRDLNGSLEIFSPDRRYTNSTTLPDEEDALLAAENYFLEVRKNSSRKSSASHRSRKTLLDLLGDETPKAAAVSATTPRRKSFKAVSPRENLERTTKVRSSTSPVLAHMGRVSPPQFSLDDSERASNQSGFSTPAQLKRTVSPALSDLELDAPGLAVPSPGGHATVGVVHGRKSGDIPEVKGSQFSEARDFQDRVASSPQDARSSVDSMDLEGCQVETEQEQEQDHHLRFGVSDSTFEWNEVFRKSARSARSPESLSNESFKSSKSTLSSSSSRGSLSDEAISERAAAWGNGVAKLVLKNSSQESTPRTSDGSAADGVNFGQKIPRVSRHVKETLSSFQLAFLVCDVVASEHPILFASAGFFEMTGYSTEEVVGRNCRFLQGADTDPKEVARMRLALKKGEAYSGTILNYKKDGTPFWNQLTLSPICDDKGLLIKYMGMQAEVKHPSIAARRKKAAGDGVCNDVPRSVCKSIAEVAPTGRHERGADVPIFTPAASRLASSGVNGKGEESKRYSLTHGIRGSKRYSLAPPATKRHSISQPGRRSLESCKAAAAARAVGGSERYTAAAGKGLSGVPQHQPSRNSFAAKPLYWLLTAARILEDEIARLGCDPNIAKECQEKFKRYEERRAERVKNKNKVNSYKLNRVASGVLGLFRKLERKVFKRETSRARGTSNRVNAYDFESDVEIDDFEDDFPMVGTRKTHNKSDRQNLRSESMPHFSPTRGVAISSSVLPADLRRRSSRYLSSAMSDKLEKRISASHTNEFVPDRQQFCIVHE